MTKKITNIIIIIVVKIRPVLICRCGGTGRRTGLKILRLNKPCRFDSGHLHHRFIKGYSHFDKSIFLSKNHYFLTMSNEMSNGFPKNILVSLICLFLNINVCLYLYILLSCNIQLEIIFKNLDIYINL